MCECVVGSLKNEMYNRQTHLSETMRKGDYAMKGRKQTS